MADSRAESAPLLQASDGGKKLDRASMWQRWIVLVLSCLLMIGNYYCFDNPSALASQLKDYFATTKYGGDHWQTYFALLYSVYSFPNIILPFIGGFFVDYFGVRIMLIIFNVLILGGQALFALGGSMRSIPIMLAGRVLFGFGGESLTVAQSALAAVWFKDKELAFAMGLNLSIARIGGVINNIVSPILWEHNHMSLWVGTIICGASLACTLILVPMDKAAEKRIAAHNPEAAKIEVDDEKIKISDVKSLSLPYWLLVLSCLVVYGTVIPFNNVASAYLQERDFLKPGVWDTNNTFIAPRDCTVKNTTSWNVDQHNYCDALKDAEHKANYVMSIPYIISAVISPFLGFAIDKFGKRAVLATAAPCVLLAVHLSLGFSTVTPYVPLVGQGLAYSVFAAALWPSVPYTVDAKVVGTGYGLLTAVQNGGLALFPVIVGQILGPCSNMPPVDHSQVMTKHHFDYCNDHSHLYQYSELFFACLAVGGILVGIWLNVDDYYKRNSQLNRAHKPKEESTSIQ